MSFREMIRKIIMDEMSQISQPAASESSTAQVSSDRQASLVRVNDLRETLVSINARKSEVLDDELIIADLEGKLDAARQRVGAHYSQLQAEYFATDYALQRELAMLQSLCSVQLTQFIDWANDEQARLMSLKANEQFSYGEKNLLVDNAPTPVLIFSNVPAISRRIKAVVAARNRAEELKLLNRTEEELRIELDSLQATLPEIDGCLERVSG